MRSLLLIAALFAPALAAAEAGPSLLAIDGKRLHGQPRLDGGSLRVDDGAAPLEHVVAFEAPGAVDGWMDQGVVLVDGQVIRGVPRALQQGTIDFASDLLGPMSLPSAQVAAVVLSPVRTVDAGAPPTGFTGLILANGDRVSGAASFINERTVGVDTGRKVAQVPRARARLLVLHPLAIPENARQVVRLANGDRIVGTCGKLAGDGFAITNALGAWTLPTRDLRSLASEGGALVPLERLPFRAEGWAFPIAVDGMCGEWLAAGGRRYERGIASHAPETLSITLDGTYASFVGEAALAAGPGTAVMKVVVDGKVAFDSGALTAADAPRPLRVPLGGARELRLVVEAGPDGVTVGDRGVWGWPTLVRP
jgi:hypothetical protein